MITVENANVYFKGRTVGGYWAEYSGEQKHAAIDQARRDLSRALKRPMRDDEPPYAEGDAVRDEFAVYEQALYTLLRDALPKAATGSDLPSLDQDEAKKPAYTLARGADWLSAEARNWLGVRQMTRVSMG